ncbi:NAD-dependent malic enzyme [Gloeobacter kilaueensis]|uniref:Malate dehydrogenase n=1 Tax=Gloeobacter kilaueensis (strain ATCC BAA-2537 / CCAP 1431/1 / ULC 316 / JS1) TaxID=1183438 RepID=U5QJ80_GLOK1|nr:NAD-dependent malic enzyme [Gloeobacter kilaueensis]AGY57735.1 malate dehydrogenase [Gloeobacter kilaueensis JS1]
MTRLTPNSSYSLILRIHLPNEPGMLARAIDAIALAGGNIGAIEMVAQERAFLVRDIVVDAASEEHAHAIVEQVRAVPELKLLLAEDRTFHLHQGGKIAIVGKTPLKSKSDLAMAYTPGVGRICLAIADEPERVYELTIKRNTVAVVTDGSAVLGLGNIGPAGALPVMEGKALLFKEFANLDAFPVCLGTQDVDAIVETVERIATVFGGINLEDISAPRCFEVERKLQERLDIPVFHDDQHGTAIVVLAALENALKLVHKSLDTVRIVINGAGAAGIAIHQLLTAAGARSIVVCDTHGIVSAGRSDLSDEKRSVAVAEAGDLTAAMDRADVFLGVSRGNVVSRQMLSGMARDPIVFAMANPIPEILPEEAAGLVAVMATGRSDYPNQINNVLAFPGIFRGALDCRARVVNLEMKMAAARAIAGLTSAADLTAESVIPSVFDRRVVEAVSAAVQQAARATGVTK